MTTPTPHPFAHVLEPLARDANASFEWQCPNGTWEPTTTKGMLIDILKELSSPYRYRVKPDTIMVGQREVPKPRTDKQTGFAMGIGGTLFYWDSMADFAQVTNALCALLEGRP